MASGDISGAEFMGSVLGEKGAGPEPVEKRFHVCGLIGCNAIIMFEKGGGRFLLGTAFLEAIPEENAGLIECDGGVGFGLENEPRSVELPGHCRKGIEIHGLSLIY
jgi:hypothetical protein